MADGGQIMKFKLNSNEILLYNRPPCALNWDLMKPNNKGFFYNENVSVSSTTLRT